MSEIYPNMAAIIPYKVLAEADTRCVSRLLISVFRSSCLSWLSDDDSRCVTSHMSYGIDVILLSQCHVFDGGLSNFH